MCDPNALLCLQPLTAIELMRQVSTAKGFVTLAHHDPSTVVALVLANRFVLVDAGDVRVGA